jgi:hypothetical protein
MMHNVALRHGCVLEAEQWSASSSKQSDSIPAPQREQVERQVQLHPHTLPVITCSQRLYAGGVSTCGDNFSEKSEV